jgi:peptidyl-lysine (3S)-dioxygenase / protease
MWISNADAVVEYEDGRRLFAEPHEIFEPFEDLASDVPPDIPFARIALGQSADAINLWLGDDRSVTSLHKDNYENIYIQVRGQKHFVLLPPIEMPCVNERLLQRGRYVSRSKDRGGKDPSVDHGHDTLIIQLDHKAEPIPVATWDPDYPNDNTTPFSHLAQPLRVTLQEGDMLYLPSMWYHKVSQTVGPEGFVCAVNYWYDMDFAGQHWANAAFVRDVFHAAQKRPAYPDLEVGGKE